MKLKSVTNRFSSGVRLLLVCHLYYAVVCAVYFIVLYLLDVLGIHVVVDGDLSGILFFVMLTAPGVIGQLVYVIPVAIYFSSTGKHQSLAGLLTGALVTGFVNIVIIFAAIKIGVSMVPPGKPVNPFLKHPDSTSRQGHRQPMSSPAPSEADSPVREGTTSISSSEKE